MKAIVSEAIGGPDTLVVVDRPVPQPGPGEVRVRVEAVGVNFPDLLIIEDKYQFRPQRPFSPGAEISGVVDALGEGVEGIETGTRVLAMLGWGGMAQMVIVPAQKLITIPDAMPFDEAAAFVMTYGTSYHALKDRARLRSGESLLVLGAAGGVGLAAVELGKAMGATVYAAVSSQEKLDIAIKAGADAGLVYPRNPLDAAAQKSLAAEIKTLCGKSGPNVIYDPVGGDYAQPALRSIAPGGRYLVVGFPAGIPSMPLNLPLLKRADILGVFWGAEIDDDPQGHRRSVAELLDFYGQSKIRPHIHATYPMEQAGEALKALAGRSTAGKIVVKMT